MHYRAIALVFALVAVFTMPAPAPAVQFGILEQISPAPAVYTFGIDFTTFFDGAFPSPTGDVTALLDAVDLGSTTSGCDASDFLGFTAGHIALIKRGGCLFGNKVINADAAGAVGVLVFDSVIETLPGVAFVADVPVPALFLTRPLGEELAAFVDRGPIEIHMAVVPAPAAGVLLGAALAMLGVGARLRRRRGYPR